MPAEDHKNMKKIQCWISLSTWQQIEENGYKSPTLAVTEAFKKLLEDPHKIPENPHRIPERSLINPLRSPY